MPFIRLQEISQAQRARLALIEQRLWFAGDIRRQDLVLRFGVQSAAATRDIALYKNIAPNNIYYDSKCKAYVLGSEFRTVFDHTPNRILSWLSEGFGDGEPTRFNSWIMCDTPARLALPDTNILASVTRAIHQQCPLQIEYHSITSGLSLREITPFALIDNGIRWHARAFDRKSQEFRDFVITRIKQAGVMKAAAVEMYERSDQDIQWTRMVEVELIPHPNQPHPEITEMDYAMTGGILRMNLRAATAGYTLRKWGVDCSPDHSLRAHEYRLWLKDHLALYGVKNAVLAPGYAEVGAKK